MLTRGLEARDLFFAAGYLIGGFALGLLMYRVVLARLRKKVTLTQSGYDDVLVGGLHDLSLIWFTTAGAFAASLALPLESRAEGIVHRSLVAVLILSATWVTARAATTASKIYALRTRGMVSSSSIITNVVRLLVFVVGVLILLQTLGVSITPLLTALGVGGLAVALALQDTLSNLFAGIQILASRQIQPGDYVKLDSGEEGYIADINWRNTSIRQLPNNMVVVPNSKIASSIVINYYRPQQELAVLFDVGVSYDSDLDEVERITVDVGREVMRDVVGGIPDFEPFIRYNAFDDSSINFTLIMRAREFTDQYLLKHELVKRLHRRYREEGITIPFPIRTVEFRDGAGGSDDSEVRRALRARKGS